MNITKEQLVLILPNSKPVAGTYLPFLQEAIELAKLNTPLRLASFLSQTGHESGHFLTTTEDLRYRAESMVKKWPSRFTPELARACVGHPERIANIAYANRMGNGDVASGDGWKFRGRGLIQLTGYRNYKLCGEWLDKDLIHDPDAVAQPEKATLSAAWYWFTNGLNAIVDTKGNPDVGSYVNTGKVGRVASHEEDRQAIFTRGLKVLK